MPVSLHLFVSLLFAIHFPGNAAEHPVDEVMLSKVEALAVKIPDDYSGYLASKTEAEIVDLRMAQEKAEAERIERIRQQPGLGPYLVVLADRYLATPHDGVPALLRSMALRNDIPQADIDRYTAVAKKIVESPPLPPVDTNDDFLIGMAALWSTHPSPEAEDILIKMIYIRNDFSGIEFKLAATRALAEIGTEKAIPAMEHAAKWMDSFEKGSHHSIKTFVSPNSKQIGSALAALRKRLHGNGKREGEIANTGVVAISQNDLTKMRKIQPLDSSSKNWMIYSWLLIVVSLAAAVGWHFWKRRK